MVGSELGAPHPRGASNFFSVVIEANPLENFAELQWSGELCLLPYLIDPAKTLGTGVVITATFPSHDLHILRTVTPNAVNWPHDTPRDTGTKVGQLFPPSKGCSTQNDVDLVPGRASSRLASTWSTGSGLAHARVSGFYSGIRQFPPPKPGSRPERKAPSETVLHPHGCAGQCIRCPTCP